MVLTCDIILSILLVCWYCKVTTSIILSHKLGLALRRLSYFGKQKGEVFYLDGVWSDQTGEKDG